ncbi:ribosome maturation factor RimM [Chitinimonas sp. BJYL2]|uniref:ribosome maturation factor RimM n=1 Tax=Chitinimonas sp. BJYL2 TaxID=2976696 RepID=UPI0022B3D0E1|nr:ribosome maturation factor RimM [Chitinimonas sp. BJYL2]
MKPASNQPIAAASAGTPADLVPMGFVAGAFGIRGWVKVVADTEHADSLLDYDTWWLGRNGVWQQYAVKDAAVHPKHLSAQLEGVDDRDRAFALKGMTIAIPRSAMPQAEDGEYYWADLIGLAVFNVQGESLGTVDNLLSTGANDVLVIKSADAERLVPFVKAVVLDVDLTARSIRVDWGLDY